LLHVLVRFGSSGPDPVCKLPPKSWVGQMNRFRFGDEPCRFGFLAGRPEERYRAPLLLDRLFPRVEQTWT
jgi:hypothetical protein